MTWVEALPTIGVTLVLGHGLALMAYLIQRRNYRGALDGRVAYTYKGEWMAMASRLKERDDRLGLYPAKAVWVHPLWRPKSFQEGALI
uniref:Uncharacterized protein n=1 Tax=Ciona intestinalis TaxID=7719 RepID=H2XMC2_CIOIN